MKKLFGNEKGQTVVIILLVMVVGLTIGLSIVNRSLSDIKISQETEQSQRAFSAAEAGLEKAILNINSPGQPAPGTINDVNYTVDKSLMGGSGTTPDGYELTEKSAVKKDEVAQINLEGGTASQLRIYWAKIDTSEAPGIPNHTTVNPCTNPPVASLEISQINYNSSANPAYTITKSAYCACSGKGNNFTLVSHDPSAGLYAYSQVIDIVNPLDAKILRIRPLFNDTSLKIKVETAGGILPDQEVRLVSKGESNGKVRAIEWRQPIKPALPALFDYVLFNGSSTNSLSQ